jgi:hypothetical protein
MPIIPLAGRRWRAKEKVRAAREQKRKAEDAGLLSSFPKSLLGREEQLVT